MTSIDGIVWPKQGEQCAASPKNSASGRGRVAGIDSTAPKEATQTTDFRLQCPVLQADTGPCSPAKALHPAPICHWKIPDKLAQTAGRCREGAEQVLDRRTPTPTLRVTSVQWQQTMGLGFVSVHQRRGSHKIP